LPCAASAGAVAPENGFDWNNLIADCLLLIVKWMIWKFRNLKLEHIMRVNNLTVWSPPAEDSKLKMKIGRL
jgi:hypothetical protein